MAFVYDLLYLIRFRDSVVVRHILIDMRHNSTICPTQLQTQYDGSKQLQYVNM